MSPSSFECFVFLVSSLSCLSGCRLDAPADGSDVAHEEGPILVRAPGGTCEIALEIVDEDGAMGVPTFRVEWGGKRVAGGRLGIDFIDGGPLTSGLRMSGVRRRDEDRTIPLPADTSAPRMELEGVRGPLGPPPTHFHPKVATGPLM
jgi:hypothetical protein